MSTKKFLKVFIILFSFILLASTTLVYASDINMNLSNNSSQDDTVYGSNTNTNSNNNANTNTNVSNSNTNAPAPISVNSRVFI